MINAIVKDLLAKNDWDRIIFRFPTTSYTLFRSEKYEIDSFCVYIFIRTEKARKWTF